MSDRLMLLVDAIYFTSILALFDLADKTGWFQDHFHTSPRTWHFVVVYILVIIIACFLPDIVNIIIACGILFTYIGWKFGKSKGG